MDRAVCYIEFGLNLFFLLLFAFLPNPRAAGGTSMHHRVFATVVAALRAQRGRVAADTPNQIFFVDDYLPRYFFVH